MYNDFGEESVNLWDFGEFYAAEFLIMDNPGCIRLTVQRKDQKDGITWDQLQDIKDKCGFADRDAIEFYPAKEDIINTGNRRHLIVLNRKHKLVWR